ncbi:LOB domain-containing protein 22-like [Euphorbia lathyris]|uniref:LOB domain-containing protein 22-like n=1 Tax=Euphorbia lathyris TaxID=212925 RepID=UPI003313D8F3
MSIPRIGNGTTQACAACKYQRRKCAPDCILAPYFPHDRQRQFLNAHKLFGVSNITKIIKNLNQPDKDEAMRTIIFQSDVRANDPVGGCYRIIRDLQRQIEFHQAELDLVLHQLAICRAQTQQLHMLEVETDDSANLGCEMVNVNGAETIYDPSSISMMQFSYPQCSTQDEQEYVQDYQQLHNNVNSLTIQESNSTSVNSPSTILSSSLHLKQPNFVDDCDDIKPLLDINDVKFEADDLVETRKYMPSTQLVISS